MTTDPPLNPYESPRNHEGQPPELEQSQNLARQRAEKLLNPPSIGLMLTATIHLLLLALALANRQALMNAIELLTGELPLRSQADIFRMLLVGSAVSVAVIVTGFRMRQLQSLRDSRVVAILCCVPMFSPLMFVGIPFGLWVLAVLSLRSVAREFDRPEPVRTFGEP